MTLKEIKEKYKGHAPVPIVRIAQGLGIKIYNTKDLPNNQSGLIREEADGSISILINYYHSATRKRFTIAHEIAHFLKHKDIISSGYVTSNKQPLCRGKVRTTEDREMEVEANKIAADILMPEENFKKIWKEADTIEEVAERFQVSVATTAIRGNQLLDEMII